MGRINRVNIILEDPPAAIVEMTGYSVAATGVDKNYTQAFTSAASVSVTHNLGKYPAVFVKDSAGDEVEGEVNHLGVNSLNVIFTSAFTGSIHCN